MLYIYIYTYVYVYVRLSVEGDICVVSVDVFAQDVIASNTKTTRSTLNNYGICGPTVDGINPASPTTYHSTIVPGGFWYIRSCRTSIINLNSVLLNVCVRGRWVVLVAFYALFPRGSRYQIIKDLGPKSHKNHGLQAPSP